MQELNRADIQRIAEIFREETGNHVQEKNFAMIESRMKTYVDRRDFKSMADYWAYFNQFERQERDAIAGLLTTHYTFFFREFTHFETLEKWIVAEGPRLKKRFQQSGQGVKVWSAACSRGQEVYSLAMFLEERLGPMAIPFQVMGSDIDKDSVAYAQNGVYPLKEVNAIPIHTLSKFVRKGTGAVKDFAAIQAEIKNKTQFRTANLMELPVDIKDGSFDVIFCRNVFIYFSEDKVKTIATKLVEKLNDGGLFVTGISEPLRFLEAKLPLAGPSAYRKGSIDASAAAAMKPAPIAAPATYRVLCVDDSPTIQKLMGRIFKSDPRCAGVDFANHGGEARRALDSAKYDLITLDIHMPEVNGIQFMETLYQAHRDPPVIMISSVNRSDLDLATKSLSLGAFDYVEKPSMNQIDKSTTEILNKTHMALKTLKRTSGPIVKAHEKANNPYESKTMKMGFDLDIARKIVVPDASRCLRIVAWSGGSANELQAVLKGQLAESRSPALVIVAGDLQNLRPIEASIQQWMGHPAAWLEHNVRTFLRPNHVYFATSKTLKPHLQEGSFQRQSLQILNHEIPGLRELFVAPSRQVLLSETLQHQKTRVEAALGIDVSDITPATSFASLSVEYFALLRAAAS